MQANVEPARFFGPTLFMFVFWIFVNVHHDFLDSVMWPRENPNTGRLLFSQPRPIQAMVSTTPPSARMAAPVVAEARGEARNTTILATSSGVVVR